MARIPKTQNKEVAATPPEAAATPPKEVAPKGIKVQAVFNRMRNPYTGAVFMTNRATDVNDLESKDNAWTRAQLRAGVLKIVK